MRTQLNRGLKRRLMYIENKDGKIAGADARIGWVTFSKSAKTIYYKDRNLTKIIGGGVRGNFIDLASGEEFWISGVKSSGSNVLAGQRVSVVVDMNAKEKYALLKIPR